MQNSWSEAASEVLQENTAQSIHQQLEQLDNQKDRYTRRWIWELFQNALDATPEGQSAEITIRHKGSNFLSAITAHRFSKKKYFTSSSMGPQNANAKVWSDGTGLAF